MSRSGSRFYCHECGYESPKWSGRCPNCNEWNSMLEKEIQVGGKRNLLIRATEPSPVTEVTLEKEQRYPTGMEEFDRVLGGGIVPGSLILVGGDPGIGKSTLLLQVAARLSLGQGNVLYASGEESVGQTRLRAERLGAMHPNLYLVAESNLELIEKYINDLKPVMVVVDSVQTTWDPEVGSSPGSLVQVRESAARLMRLAKALNISIFLIGHVTKEGMLAGPRVLEHMVDTVLYLEGDRHLALRVLRGVKNRFGSTNEIGLFSMHESGLVEVNNPSEIFLSQRPESVPGSAVVATLEGTRPILLEIQALVSSSAFGNPRRLSTGLELSRCLLMIAVLEKKIGLQLGLEDIYINAAGGVKVDEPAVDLAVCLAVSSSHRNVIVDPLTVVMGEVGLTGEVRGIIQVEKRLKEAAKMGFKRAIVPANSLRYLGAVPEIEITGVRSVEEALEAALGGLNR
ncbi:MAG: DNA repair protein RadA [Bacillota bacterium]